LDFGKCDNCGGNLKYDIDKESLFCEHCGQSQKSSKNIELEKSEMDKTKNKGDYIEDILFAKCQNCGAGIVYEDMELTFECPYCKTSNLLKIEDTNGLTPQGIIPFKINDEEAKAIFEKVVNKKIRKNRDEIIKTANIYKVYAPCFFFDMTVHCMQFEKVEDIEFKHIYSYSRKSKNIHKHKHKEKEDIAVLANDRDIPKDASKVAKFKPEDIVAFDEKYLAGYNAEKPTLSLLRAFGEAQNELSKEFYSDSYEYNFGKGEWIYLLIPMYIISYKNKEKYKCFYINGSTGELHNRKTKNKYKTKKVGTDFGECIWYIIGILLGIILSMIENGG